MDTSQDCWEFKKCGKEKECPAYPDSGKSCYSITATLCRGTTQGTYDEKAGACRTTCDFYKKMFSQIYKDDP